MADRNLWWVSILPLNRSFMARFIWESWKLSFEDGGKWATKWQEPKSLNYQLKGGGEMTNSQKYLFWRNNKLHCFCAIKKKKSWVQFGWLKRRNMTNPDVGNDIRKGMKTEYVNCLRKTVCLSFNRFRKRHSVKRHWVIFPFLKAFPCYP